ncbi:MAG TPA: hypothetical protein VIO94_08095, partial [Phenylobacterium sp.]
MKTPVTMGLVAAAAMTVAAPAANAQYYPGERQYREDLSRYQSQRSDYEARRDNYEVARREYDRRRADYDRARAAYDARWGYGSYARLYGPAPVWNDDDYADYADAPSAGYYGRNTAYGAAATSDIDCRRTEDRNATAGGLIGALAGAVLGS